MGMGYIENRRFFVVLMILGLLISCAFVGLADDEVDKLQERVKKLEEQVENLQGELEKTKANQAVISTSWFNFVRFYDNYIRTTGGAFVPNKEWNKVRDMALTIYGVEVIPSYIGVDTETVDDEVVERQNLAVRRGARITRIYSETPASSSELQEGDVILSVEVVEGKKERKERKIGYAHMFRGLVWSTVPGAKLELRIIRNGEFKQVTVETEKMSFS